MHLTLHLTSRCNLNCRYCYVVPRERDDMSSETAKAAIDLSISGNLKRNSSDSLGVIFFGGEPLLCRNLIAEIIRYCREVESETDQKFYFKITTNGLLLDEAFLSDKDTADVFVALSHDGVKPAHDMHRTDTAGNGSFDRLSTVLPLLLQHRPYAPALSVVTPKTLPHYAESVAWLFDQGFRYLIFSLDYGAQWNSGSVRELRHQYKKIADWYYTKTMEEEKFYFSPFEVKIASHVFPGSCTRDRCELGLRQISVAPDGRLYPCVQFVGDDAYAIGNVWQGIDEIARQRLFKQNAREKDSCVDCAVRDRCNHYCGCLNRQATGSIDNVSPMLCTHEKTVIPIVDRLASRLFEQRNSLFIQKHYNDLFPLLSLVEDNAAAGG